MDSFERHFPKGNSEDTTVDFPATVIDEETGGIEGLQRPEPDLFHGIDRSLYPDYIFLEPVSLDGITIVEFCSELIDGGREFQGMRVTYADGSTATIGDWIEKHVSIKQNLTGCENPSLWFWQPVVALPIADMGISNSPELREVSAPLKGKIIWAFDEEGDNLIFIEMDDGKMAHLKSIPGEKYDLLKSGFIPRGLERSD